MNKGQKTERRASDSRITEATSSILTSLTFCSWSFCSLRKADVDIAGVETPIHVAIFYRYFAETATINDLKPIHKCSISFTVVSSLFSICRYYCRQLCRWNYSRTERDCYALPEDVVLSGSNQLHTIRLHHTPVFTWGQRNSAHTCRYAVWSVKLTIYC